MTIESLYDSADQLKNWRLKMAQGRRTLRLILCGICFKESCQFSRWVEEDEPDGELVQLLDEIQQMWLQSQHEQIDLYEKSQQQIEATIDDVQSIANSTGDTIEVQTMIDGEVKSFVYEPVKTQDDGFLDSLLRNAAEHVEKSIDENTKQQH